MESLKHIVVNVNVDDDDVNPCSVFLPSSKKCAVKISSKNVTIEIPDANCHQGDEWGRLDEVLTTPGWFSLKRVSLTIEFASFSRSDDEIGRAHV